MWSNYAALGTWCISCFYLTSILSDIHIFTASKQPWVVLPPGALAFAEYYDTKTTSPAASFARRQALFG